VFPLAPNKSVRNIPLDRGSEERWFLRDEADLSTEPFDVELTEIVAVEPHGASEGIIEPLDKRHDRTRQTNLCQHPTNNEHDQATASPGSESSPENLPLPRSTSSHERRCLSRLKGDAQVLHDGHVGSTGVVKLDMIELNAANDIRRFEARGGGAVNERDTVDRGEEFSGRTASVGYGCRRAVLVDEGEKGGMVPLRTLHLRRHQRDRERPDKDGQEDIYDLSGGCLVPQYKRSAKRKR
jgi:hypothetical protein